MVYKYANFVVKSKIEINEDKEFRYLLKIPFTDTPKNSALIILKNPSVATGSESDHTINRLCNYCYKKGIDEVYVANLFAYRAQNANIMVSIAGEKGDDYIIGEHNDECIINVKDKVKTIILAWGKHPSYYKTQYLARIEKVMSILSNNDAYYVDRLCGKEKYPLHAQPWGYGMMLYLYKGGNILNKLGIKKSTIVLGISDIVPEGYDKIAKCKKCGLTNLVNNTGRCRLCNGDGNTSHHIEGSV